MAKMRPGVYQEEVLESARALSKLNESAFEKIIETVSSIPPNLSISKAIKKADISIDGVTKDEFQDVLTLAFSIKNFSERSKRSIPSIIEDINELAKLGSDSAAFEKYLTTLLSNRDVRRWQKALSLVSEHERILLETRLFTDARPVYVEEPDEEPDAFVMFHMLRVTYREDFEQKEIYLALDSDDLFELKANVERAIKKRGSVAAKIRQSGTSLFDMAS
jgi:hypothetical protein